MRLWVVVLSFALACEWFETCKQRIEIEGQPEISSDLALTHQLCPIGKGKGDRQLQSRILNRYCQFHLSNGNIAFSLWSHGSVRHESVADRPFILA